MQKPYYYKLEKNNYKIKISKLNIYIRMSEESSSFVAPAGLLERVRNLNQIYKQTIRLLPVQQGAVVN
jgi:hypothetical protein